MKLQIQLGSTSRRVIVAFKDSSSTTGAFLTGVTSAKLTASYTREDDGNAGATVISLSAGTRGSWSTGTIVEKDSSTAKGDCEFSIPNACLVAGSKWVTITFQDSGSNNIAPVKLEIQLTAYNPDSATNLGLSCLPTGNPGTLNSLIIAGTNVPITFTGFGNAFSCISTGSGGHGFYSQGNGSGDGDHSQGGVTGSGRHSQGGATSGWGERNVGVNGFDGMCNESTGTGDGSGQKNIGVNAGHGTKDKGGLTGDGHQYQGGNTSGYGANFLKVGTGGDIGLTGDGRIHGTIDTLTTYTGDTPQTRDCDTIYTRLGAPAGASVSADIALTAKTTDLVTIDSVVIGILDKSLSGHNTAGTAGAGLTFLDATITSRASPTNITAGTITTVTNLTNAPTAGDFTAVMKTSLNAAAPSVPTASQIAAAVNTDTTNVTTVGSPAYVIVHNIGSAFTGPTTSIFTSQALANAPGSSSGFGAFPMVVKVTSDGSTAIVGVQVRVSGAQSGLNVTDGSGNASLSLDAGAVTISVSAPGYYYVPTVQTVNGSGHWVSTGTATFTITMVANPVVAPSTDPLLTNCYFTARTALGVAKAGVIFTFTLVDADRSTDAWSSSTTVTATSDSTGLVQITLPTFAKFKMIGPDGSFVRITTGSNPTTQLPEYVGAF